MPNQVRALLLTCFCSYVQKQDDSALSVEMLHSLLHSAFFFCFSSVARSFARSSITPCNASVFPTPVFNATPVKYFCAQSSLSELVEPRMFDSVLDKPPCVNDFKASCLQVHLALEPALFLFQQCAPRSTRFQQRCLPCRSPRASSLRQAHLFVRPIDPVQ
jgi:hypothetical protein